MIDHIEKHRPFFLRDATETSLKFKLLFDVLFEKHGVAKCDARQFGLRLKSPFTPLSCVIVFCLLLLYWVRYLTPVAKSGPCVLDLCQFLF